MEFKPVESLNTLEELEQEMEFLLGMLNKEKEKRANVKKQLDKMEEKQKGLHKQVRELSVGKVRWNRINLYLMAEDEYDSKQNCYTAPAMDLNGNLYKIIWDIEDDKKDPIDRFLVWSL